MAKFTTMLSVWLWIGIFVFLYLYLRSRKEIKIAELESVHLCVIFFICCLAGPPIAVIELFDLFKNDEEEDEDCNESLDEETEEEYNKKVVMQLEEIKDRIDLLLKHF